MEFNTTDQEDVERLKRWWQENGTSLVGGVVVGLALLLGWQQWNHYVDQQGMASSQYFEQLQGALMRKQFDKAVLAGEHLVERYGSTVYAAHGVLALAAWEMEQGELAAARERYHWVLEQSQFDSAKELARLGIVRSHLAESNPALALQQMEQEPITLYHAHFSELRGDALRQQGAIEAAQGAYVEALAQLDPVDERRDLLEMKLAEVTP